MIIPARKKLAHEDMKNEHKQAREANDANCELAWFLSRILCFSLPPEQGEQ